jgi:hypothetical protein
MWARRTAARAALLACLLAAAAAPRAGAAGGAAASASPEAAMAKWLIGMGAEVGVARLQRGRPPDPIPRPLQLGGVRPRPPARPPAQLSARRARPILTRPPQLNAAGEARDGGERGAYAARDIPAGGVIAKVPLAAGLFFSNTSGFAELGAVVAAEAAKGASGRWGPYFATLPMARDPGHTLNFATFPPEYLHLLLSELMVRKGVGWSGGGVGGFKGASGLVPAPLSACACCCPS